MSKKHVVGAYMSFLDTEAKFETEREVEDAREALYEQLNKLSKKRRKKNLILNIISCWQVLKVADDENIQVNEAKEELFELLEELENFA
jgi:hypothetical protein